MPQRRSDRLPEDLPDMEIPAAVQHLNYPGDVRGSIGSVMGPMLESVDVPAGQYLTVVEEHFDEATGVTRLGLTYGVVEIPTDGAA